MDTTTLIITTTLYFLALVNPASKIFILSTIHPRPSSRELAAMALRATLAAFFILLAVTVGGKYLLRDIFKVDIYSLQIAGGIILFLIGLMAVRQGRFFEKAPDAGTTDISIVPLAAPMIAGPGTITGVISFASTHGLPAALISITLALFVNLILMLFAAQIGRILERVHATGPLIRITGLIVAAVAVQMTLDGLADWSGNNLHFVLPVEPPFP